MPKPNLLVLMADQLTPYMLGCYSNPLVKTPNLDALRRQSVCFDNAYTPNPLCTPARAAFMTGLYTDRLGCFDNCHDFASAQPTFAHHLTVAGYQTALCGKMHFVGPDQLHGFGRRLTTDVYPADYSWLPSFQDEEKHIMQGPWGNACNYTGQMLRSEEWNLFLGYDEETQFRAKEYLYGAASQSQQPFCLCVSYHHPHDPFIPPQRYYDLYQGVEFPIPDPQSLQNPQATVMDRWLDNGFHRLDLYDITPPENLQQLRRCYAALVSYIDDKVGELLAVLRDTGMDENTVIVFTSDHGDMLGQRGMVQKRCFYEWSAKVPLLLRLPGMAHAGRRVSDPCSLLDVAPTLLALADPHPEYPMECDGRSLLDALEQPDAQRLIFSEYHGEGVLWPCYMVRRGRYKYIYIYQKERRLFELHPNC